MSVIYDVHQVPIGIPHVWPTTHAELVEQPWLIYSLTAVWRLDLSKKHPFVGNVVGVLVGGGSGTFTKACIHSTERSINGGGGGWIVTP